MWDPVLKNTGCQNVREEVARRLQLAEFYVELRGKWTRKEWERNTSEVFEMTDVKKLWTRSMRSLDRVVERRPIVKRSGYFIGLHSMERQTLQWVGSGMHKPIAVSSYVVFVNLADKSVSIVNQHQVAKLRRQQHLHRQHNNILNNMQNAVKTGINLRSNIIC